MFTLKTAQFLLFSVYKLKIMYECMCLKHKTVPSSLEAKIFKILCFYNHTLIKNNYYFCITLTFENNDYFQTVVLYFVFAIIFVTFFQKICNLITPVLF